MYNKNINENEDLFMTSNDNQISMIAEISTEMEEDVVKMDFSKEIPIMPLRNMV